MSDPRTCGINGCTKGWQHRGVCVVNNAIGKTRVKAAQGKVQVVQPGTKLNIQWADGSWWLATAGNFSSRGTYCYYQDGERRYERLEQMKYVVMQDATTAHSEKMESLKTRKVHSAVYQAAEYELKCAICLEVFTSPMMLKCQHIFCYGCIQTTLSVANSASERQCPECRCPFVSMRDAVPPHPIITKLSATLRTSDHPDWSIDGLLPVSTGEPAASSLSASTLLTGASSSTDTSSRAIQDDDAATARLLINILPSPDPCSCAVCLEQFGDDSGYVLQCGHSFHAQCIQRIYQSAYSVVCPLCRYCDRTHIVRDGRLLRIITQ
tara:strand:+ start:995 stop:1963 length:969 start_codon:yes stop_codon:yes gene_type:complete